MLYVYENFLYYHEALELLSTMKLKCSYVLQERYKALKFFQYISNGEAL